MIGDINLLTLCQDIQKLGLGATHTILGATFQILARPAHLGADHGHVLVDIVRPLGSREVREVTRHAHHVTFTTNWYWTKEVQLLEPVRVVGDNAVVRLLDDAGSRILHDLSWILRFSSLISRSFWASI